ncbi:GNAT family N-acetyltransferase [Croceivirga thetidis]|uniref:GNAT family N-acetyltransferase n=1 Tax=Croceivirga thetidis TaxID=2721623 RepID=A0ABX1GME3_9FLAO|nr:GNAT family protein [Croceivirga thetidis]NKI31081.1 GNAT family N-acetyltransferase [Croceivirga thetidis]
MEITFDNYSISPIKTKDAWRVCNFVVANEKRLADFFPQTLKENLTPTLAELFVQKKEKQFNNKEEFLFSIKENTNRSIIGLVYLKELHKKEGQAEIAYCISYQYENKGLMAKIVGEIAKWAFTNVEITVLQAIIHDTNLASRKVAEKNSFKFITVLQKEHQMADGSIADMQLYELRKSEFQD